jgi:hypothetical protein
MDSGTMDLPSITSTPTRLRWPCLAAAPAVAALLAALIPGHALAESFHGKLRTATAARTAAKQDPRQGTLGAAARIAIRDGYLVPDRAQYERQKARTARGATGQRALAAPASGEATAALVAGRSWQGISNPNRAPPDETSAVGTTRYVELINNNFAIYNKTANAPISTGTLHSLAGVGASDTLLNPQVIWDPTTSRFYFAASHVVSGDENRLAFGFSQTASPNGAADWCKYSLNFGTNFLDSPKLGDSRFFMVVGSNLFGSSGFIGSDLLAISKPPPSPDCPAPASFKVGDVAPLKVAGARAFAAAGVNQIDTTGTGWAVSRSGRMPDTQLYLFKVRRDPNTREPILQRNGTPVTVPRYRMPPNAPQMGSVNRLDTLDTRPTQAVAATDPAHDGKLGIWTQHTVNVAGRSAVRWYEIDPWARTLLQRGVARHPTQFLFNGAISPNRKVNGATVTGGNAMILSYNTSSGASFPGIKMVSKIGAGTQSGPVVIKDSTGPLSGLGCDDTEQLCRWGDYAAATPDPGTGNRTWQVSQFAVGSGSGTTGPATARTWHFIATP